MKANSFLNRLNLLVLFAMFLAIFSSVSVNAQTSDSSKFQIVQVKPVFGFGSMAKIDDSLKMSLPFNAIRIGAQTKLNFSKSLSFNYDFGIGLGEQFNFTSYALSYTRKSWNIVLGNTASVTTYLRPYPLDVVNSMYESKPMKYIGQGGMTLRSFINLQDFKLGLSISEKGKTFLDSTQYAATISYGKFTLAAQICNKSYALIGLYKSTNFEQFAYWENTNLLTGYTRINLESILHFPLQAKVEYCFDFDSNKIGNGRNLIRVKLFTLINTTLFNGCVFLMVDQFGGFNFGVGSNLN